MSAPFNPLKPDLPAVGLALWRPALVWLLMVVAMLIAGQPGVVCLTPAAWLLALLAGRDVVVWSHSPRPAGPLFEAALAGGLLALFQGIVFGVVMALGPEVRPDEMPGAVGLAAFMCLGGGLVCPALSGLMALLTLRRQERDARAEQQADLP